MEDSLSAGYWLVNTHFAGARCPYTGAAAMPPKKPPTPKGGTVEQEPDPLAHLDEFYRKPLVPLMLVARCVTRFACAAMRVRVRVGGSSGRSRERRIIPLRTEESPLRSVFDSASPPVNFQLITGRDRN